MIVFGNQLIQFRLEEMSVILRQASFYLRVKLRAKDFSSSRCRRYRQRKSDVAKPHYSYPQNTSPP